MKTNYLKLKLNEENPLEKTGIPPREKSLSYDVVVIGGGMAGVCAAVAAARNKVKTLLIQDRPVLGGNASSEIRVCINGAQMLDSKHPIERETGIIEEILLENLKYNPQDSYEVWSHILYDFVTREPYLKLMLNTQAVDAVTDNAKIITAVCQQSTTETRFQINAQIFIDCSGDGFLAAVAGAQYRTGREAASEFNESFAPLKADGWQMGASLMMSTRNLGRPSKYIAPAFAIKFDPFKFNRTIAKNIKEGYWWIELGSDDDIIAEQETNRHKLMGYLHGVWDYIKNSGDFPEAENLALDWVGSVPGKRESRRFVGDYILSQNDLVKNRHFDDAVAYGGWPIDEHATSGIENHTDPAGWNHHYFKKIYQIPFRSLYSKNITNLMFAGRNISQTHIALCSTRVMSTGGVVGHAVGVAGALCCKYNISPSKLSSNHISKLQQQLTKEDAYIPNYFAQDIRDLAVIAEFKASSTSSGDVSLLKDGISRNEDSLCHHWQSESMPATIELYWEKQCTLSLISLKFDTDLHSMIWKVMKSTNKTELPYMSQPLPAVLIKKFTIEALIKGKMEVLATIDNNHRRMVNCEFSPIETTYLRINLQETYGALTAKLFEVRCY